MRRRRNRLTTILLLPMLLHCAGPTQADLETSLRHDLDTMRSCIEQFRSDQREYPQELVALVEDGYLRSMPVDPMTRSSTTWVSMLDSATGRVTDVRSGAPGVSSDGTAFSSW